MPAGTAAPTKGERATGDVAAKRCKKGRARHKGRCVKGCPRGYAKKRKRGVRRCVKLAGRREQGGPAPGPSPGNPAPAPGQAPNPNQVQLTRDDAAGQAAVSGGDLLLERASFGSSGRTAEYHHHDAEGERRRRPRVPLE